MYRNEFTAKVGFTRILDRTCSDCGGLYSSNEKSHCPKCAKPLVIPARPTSDGPLPYCFTEVTLYPLMRQETKDKHAKRTEAAHGLLYVIRVILWGTYDKERNIVVPDKRSQYMVPTRTIRALFNNPPTLIPYTANDGSQKIEMKFTFDWRLGDQIEFLDAKQEMATKIAEADTAIAQASNKTAAPVPDPAILQQQMTAIMEAFKAAGLVLPAPNPAEVGMDDCPSDEVMAQEVVTDPFVS